MVAKSKFMTIFLIIFIGAIIAVTFLGDIADRVDEQTDFLAVTNESLDLSVARIDAEGSINESYPFQLARRPHIAGESNQSIQNLVVTLYNATTLTNETDYNFNASNGTINFVNNSLTQGYNVSNVTYATYDHANENYVADSSTRAFVALILIFGALAIIVFVIVMFMSSEKMKELLRVGGR